MNYYRYFYGQNNTNGMIMPNEMPMPTGMTQPTGAAADTANQPVQSDSAGGITTPDYSGGGIEPPIGGITPPDYSGGGIEPPIGELPGSGIVPPIGEIPNPGIEPPIGELPGGIVPPIGELPGSGITPPIGTLPNYPSNTVQYTLRNCMNNLVYLRTRNGEIFWFYPTRMDFNRVYGYRWGWQSGWYNYDMPYSDIWSAYCYIN